MKEHIRNYKVFVWASACAALVMFFASIPGIIKSAPTGDKASMSGITANPQIIDKLDLPYNSRINTIFQAGEYLYIGSERLPGGLWEFSIYKVKTPVAAPELIGTLDIESAINDIYVPADATGVSGNIAYLATDNNARELIVVNVEDKAHPMVIGGYDADEGLDAISVYTKGTTVYLGTMNNSGTGDNEFYVLNATNPAVITLLGSYDVQGSVEDIALNGNYAYLANSGSVAPEMLTLDVSNPLAITQTAAYNVTGDFSGRAVEYNEGYVYLATDNNNAYYDFIVFNAQNPQSPIFLTGLDLGTNNTDIDLSKDVAYIASRDAVAGLRLIDISDPAHPMPFESLALPSPAWDVALVSGTVYLGMKPINGSEELLIVNPKLTTPIQLTDINNDGIVRIGCLGDSNTVYAPILGENYSWCEHMLHQFQAAGSTNIEVTNRAWGGVAALTTGGQFYGLSTDAIDYLNKMIAEDNVDLIVMAVGTNDAKYVLQDKTHVLQDVIGALDYLRATAQAGVPGAQLFMTMIPQGAARDYTLDLNRLIQKHYSTKELIDLYSPMKYPDDYPVPDPVHFNQTGQIKRGNIVFTKFTLGQLWQ